MPSSKGRPGAVRKKAKSPKVGSGGQGRKSLEGKGPTPKAEDRTYHPAGKRKAAAERLAARPGQQRVAGQQRQPARRPKSTDESEIVGGRNSVVEALRARIPATALYIAQRIEMDDRVREAIALAGHRGIALLEVTRPELDRLTGEDSVNQGIALKVPPYTYAHPLELLDSIEGRDQVPLIVAVDGITDPRNLGAILRSVAAFGGQGVVVPQRRSVGVTAAAWKTSAGAAARVPVAMAPNLTQTLKALKERGLFVVGLDADGDVSLP
ncbi:MAG TPA: RNA methyltransferase, partial [Naasia sp.]